MEAVVSALRSINLERYAVALKNDGWDHLPSLQASSEMDLVEVTKRVRMLPGHARRFVKMFVQWPSGSAVQTQQGVSSPLLAQHPPPSLPAGSRAAGPTPINPKSCECSLEVQLLNPSKAHCCVDSDACSLELQMTHSQEKPCIRGQGFGCHGSLAMYTSAGCRGRFMCNGGYLRCGHFGVGDKASACSCANPRVAPATRGAVGYSHPDLIRRGSAWYWSADTLRHGLGSPRVSEGRVDGSCALVIFKHIEKTAGTSLAAWFFGMSVRGGGGAMGYYSGWTADTKALRNCAVVKVPHGQPARCCHIEVQHRHVVGQFARRFRGNASHAEGWRHLIEKLADAPHASLARSGQPQSMATHLRSLHGNALAADFAVGHDDVQQFGRIRRPWQAVLEIHGTDKHLPSLLQLVKRARHASPLLHGCRALVITMLRSPSAYVRSKYLWYITNGYVSKATTFEAFARQNADPQAHDLLRGFRHIKPWTPRSLLLQEAISLLEYGIDLAAPTERFQELLGVLCARLALPRCPCAPTRRVGEDDAKERKRYVKPYEYRAITQVNATLDKAAALALQFATVDRELYKWVDRSFRMHLAATYRGGQAVIPKLCAPA